MKKRGLLLITAVLLTAALTLAGCPNPAGSLASGADLAATSTLGGVEVGSWSESGGVLTASITVSHAARQAVVFTPVFESGSQGAAVTAYAGSAGGGDYAALASGGYNFAPGGQSLWVKVVSEDGAATKFYRIVVSVANPVIADGTPSLGTGTTSITITGSQFKTSGLILGDFTIGGSASSKVTGIESGNTATSVTFTLSSALSTNGEYLTIQAKASAFAPDASGASNTLSYSLPWGPYTLVEGNVDGEVTFANVKFYLVSQAAAVDAFADTLTIVTTPAQAQAALGAPVTRIRSTDNGKTLVAIEFSASGASGYAVKYGADELSTGEPGANTVLVSTNAVTTKPNVTVTLQGAPVTINGQPDTPLTTKTLTYAIAGAVVATAKEDADVSLSFDVPNGLEYTLNANANASSFTIKISGTPEESVFDHIAINGSILYSFGSFLKYANGTSLESNDYNDIAVSGEAVYNITQPWGPYTLAEGNVDGEGTFANVKFYLAPQAVVDAFHPTIVTTPAQAQAALGAPVTQISSTDNGKYLAAIEFSASGASGYAVNYGADVLSTASPEQDDTLVSLSEVTAKPDITITLRDSPVTINIQIGTHLSKTLTYDITGAVVATAMTNKDLSHYFGVPDGLTYTLNANANASSFTLTISGTPKAPLFEMLYFEGVDLYWVDSSFLEYANGTSLEFDDYEGIAVSMLAVYNTSMPPISLPVSTTGRLTITGIESLNGKYVIASVGGYNSSEPPKSMPAEEEADPLILYDVNEEPESGEALPIVGVGGTSITLPNFTGVLVSNGRAEIPIYLADLETYTFSAYTGNDQGVMIMLLAFSSQTINIWSLDMGNADYYQFIANFAGGNATLSPPVLPSSTTGLLTVNDLGDWEGKYVTATGYSSNAAIFGFGGSGGSRVLFPQVTGVLVSNGKAEIPVYLLDYSNFTFSSYTGSETAFISLSVFDQAAINLWNVIEAQSYSVTFSNGNATVGADDLNNYD
jgi:hypothetical protein